jgi:hypothetical protein
VFRRAPGDLDGEAFIAAATQGSQAEGRAFDANRFFCATDDLFQSDGQTYALTNQWGGPGLAEIINALLEAFPGCTVSCTPADPGD